MKNDIIKEIWEIKGIVDVAVKLQDLETYNQAKKRICKLYENEEHLKTIATLTFNANYETIEQQEFDQGVNFAVIAADFAKERENIDGSGYEKDMFQFSSLLELIWYTRYMYDEFLFALSNSTNDEEIKTIYDSICYNLQHCIGAYNNYHTTDKSTLYEKMSLNQIYNDFVEVYGAEFSQTEQL